MDRQHATEHRVNWLSIVEGKLDETYTENTYGMRTWVSFASVKMVLRSMQGRKDFFPRKRSTWGLEYGEFYRVGMDRKRDILFVKMWDRVRENMAMTMKCKQW